MGLGVGGVRVSGVFWRSGLLLRGVRLLGRGSLWLGN